MSINESRYHGKWKNVQDDCLLCDMDRKTDWYLETPRFLIAEKLGGGPFIVFKEHRDFLHDEEFRQAKHLVGLLFDDFELEVRMNMVKDHWHSHIVTSDDIDLSGE